MIVVATAKTRKGKVNEIDSNSPEMGTPTKEANPQLNSVPAAATPLSREVASRRTSRCKDRPEGSNHALAAPLIPINIKIK